MRAALALSVAAPSAFGRHFATLSGLAQPAKESGASSPSAGLASSPGQSHDKTLVTGAAGQVGLQLLPFLQERLGEQNVVASDIQHRPQITGLFEYCDVQDKDGLSRIIKNYGCTRVIHLASLLSAAGEGNPSRTLQINNGGIQNVLELAVQHNLQVLSPSSIAVFGLHYSKENTLNDTVMCPTTAYGVSKVHTELLGAYYEHHYNTDFRSLRLPGIIGKGDAGGGTTDYAVDMFKAAVDAKGTYTCYLPEDLALPFMYMPDCLQAMWRLIQAPREQLSRTTYNVQGFSLAPRDLAAAIRGHYPDFEMKCTPDFRAEIANSWPRSVDDSLARADWGWHPQYDLQCMTADMLRSGSGL